MSKSKKKRYQETRKLANRIKALLDEGRIEEDVKGVQIIKVTKASTKQAMVARVSNDCYIAPLAIFLKITLLASSCIGSTPQPIDVFRGLLWSKQEQLQS